MVYFTMLGPDYYKIMLDVWLQFEGVGPIERIKGLHHFKRWAENTLRVGGKGVLSKNMIVFSSTSSYI